MTDLVDKVKKELGGLLSVDRHTHIYVEPCSACGGRGYTSWEVEDRHRNDSTTHYKSCEACESEGRVVVTQKKLQLRLRMQYVLLRDDTTRVPFSQNPIMKPLSTTEHVSVPLNFDNVRIS